MVQTISTVRDSCAAKVFPRLRKTSCALLIVAASLSTLLVGACSPLQPTSSPTPSDGLGQANADPNQKTQPKGTPVQQPERTLTPIASSTVAPTPRPFIRGPIAIGTSVAGRDLEVFQFGTGESRRMIVAGIHGGYEGNTIRLADELIQVLAVRPDLIPDNVTLYILRSLNPDGEARSDSYKGRANDNLVDLNRNWPAFWQSTWPLEGCWTYTYVSGGSHPASEPETRVLINFLTTYQIEALISYHSAVLGIFPGGQPPDPDSTSLALEISKVSDYAYPPIETHCQYTGQLIDWASQQGIAAVDIELTNHQDTDLWQNLKVLEVFLAWNKDQPEPKEE